MANAERVKDAAEAYRFAAWQEPNLCTEGVRAPFR